MNFMWVSGTPEPEFCVSIETLPLSIPLFSLTDDEHRVYLLSHPQGYGGYINAVFVNVSLSLFFIEDMKILFVHR